MLDHWPDHAELARDVVVCEQEGDRITHDIIQRLNSTFVTPIDREDIYALASALDDIVDYIEEVADFLGLYRIEAPMEQAQQLARILLEACAPGRRGDPAAAHVPRHRPLHRRDQPPGERRRPGPARGAGVAVRARHRPDARDPLEGHLRAPGGRHRRLRDDGEHPRGHRHQERLASSAMDNVSSSGSSSPPRSPSTSPTASTTPPTRWRRRSRPARWRRAWRSPWRRS